MVAPVVCCVLYRGKGTAPRSNPAPSTMPVAVSLPRAGVPKSSMAPPRVPRSDETPKRLAPTRKAPEPPACPGLPWNGREGLPRMTVNTPTTADTRDTAPPTRARRDRLAREEAGSKMAFTNAITAITRARGHGGVLALGPV